MSFYDGLRVGPHDQSSGSIRIIKYKDGQPYKETVKTVAEVEGDRRFKEKMENMKAEEIAELIAQLEQGATT